MAADETPTPVFTEEEVYMIVGYVSGLLCVEGDFTAATEAAIPAVLNRIRG